ncbi:fumarylacetoacetate hydrolase family protein, partial [Paucibacter sp. XJ19-41]
SRPATAFAPVALTPDELGEAWQGGRARLTLQAMVNGRKSGGVGSETGGRWHLGQLIAHAARTRRLRAGSLVGSEPLDLQALPALKFGDSLRLELKSADGLSPFSAIDQDVEALA